jgi:endonuclease YncB( thermonuclease family)
MPTRCSIIYNALVNNCKYVFCNSLYEYEELQNKTTNVPLFSLNGKSFTAKIVDIYDGDTITVVFKVFGEYYKWNCRIKHVDTPEIKTKDKIEKERAIFVRDKLRELLLNTIVQITCSIDKKDKYGRLLIEFNIPKSNTKIHEWILQNNYGRTYEGDTKKPWNTESWYINT